MANTPFWRDPNHAPAAGGLTDDGGINVEPIRIDPTTHRVKVTATTTDLIGTQTRTVEAVSVDNTVGGVEIVATDTTKRSHVIYNNGTATIYLGPVGVTTLSGLPLTAGSAYRESNIVVAIYGITAGTTEDIRVMSITEI